MSGKLNNVGMTICNVYIHPGSNYDFYRKMVDFMIGAPGFVICGGDWNFRFSTDLDTCKKVPITVTHKKSE